MFTGKGGTRNSKNDRLLQSEVDTGRKKIVN